MLGNGHHALATATELNRELPTSYGEPVRRDAIQIQDSYGLGSRNVRKCGIKVVVSCHRYHMVRSPRAEPQLLFLMVRQYLQTSEIFVENPGIY